MLRVMLLLFTLALLAAAGAAFWAAQALTRPLPIDAPVIVEVAPGAALGQVAASLAARGILPTPELLTAWGRVTGKAAGLHVGEYRVEPGTDARGLLEQFVRGKVLRRSLTLLPGWRFGDVRRALEAAPRLAQTLGDADGAEIMARLGAPGVAPEGRFFPDTYDYVAGDTDLAILRRAHARMQAVLAEEWARRVPDLPLTSPDEALVLASLIEKETGVATDRARIAGVFTRRLELGMRLQTDPAVIYGLGDAFDGNLTRRDLRTPTPWNTYMNSGLPPTPIALPGRESIRAALAPAVDSALYFVARGDGSSEFSATLAEHQAAVRRFQLQRRADYRSSPAPDADADGDADTDAPRPARPAAPSPDRSTP